MKIPKRFTGHAAAILRSLLKHYRPPTRIETMSNFYDRTEDGPEVHLIQFFYHHPMGKEGGIAKCLHV